MSLKTWKKEFYPVPAPRVSKKRAAEHSLQKWRGLTRQNLRKHQMVFYNGNIREVDGPEMFSIEASTCALYQAFGNCHRCPLGCLDPWACDVFVNESALWTWTFRKDPWPMIRALKLVVKQQKKEKR